jgi:alpha-D-ribose 1-methylphosphonate 5-triphosphate synthase subunit PhnH
LKTCKEGHVLTVVPVEFNYLDGRETAMQILKDPLSAVCAPIVDVDNLVGLTDALKDIVKPLLEFRQGLLLVEKGNEHGDIRFVFHLTDFIC